MNCGRGCTLWCIYSDPLLRVANLSRLVLTWTEGALSSLTFTVRCQALDCCRNSVESSLSFSLFISLTLKGEINKVNVKQTISISLYHSVSVSQLIQSTNCHSPHQIPGYHWINSSAQIVGLQIARERRATKPRPRMAACVDGSRLCPR